ncbi:MAG: response regulator transcription factor [Bacteroidales bacterium]|nr:response regulator transcription factor [Bacteroidales bacterium]
MDRHIKLIIVDDHQMFREGLKFLLRETPGIKLIGEAENGKFFLKLLDDAKPDVVLMDISMPEMDGIEATRQALMKYPDLKIIALTMFGEENYYYQMIQAGAKGLVLKKSGKTELVSAIEKVLKGESYFSNELLINIISKTDKEKLLISDKTVDIKFTKREKQILDLLIRGFSTSHIAAELNISHRTVEGHKARLFDKTGIRNTSRLILAAMRHKWTGK